MRWVLVALVVMSCRGPWVTVRTEDSYTEKRQVDCTKTSVCWECEWDMAVDHLDCGYERSFACRGRKWVLIEVQPVIGHYENRPDEYKKRLWERWIKDLTECE